MSLKRLLLLIPILAFANNTAHVSNNKVLWKNKDYFILKRSSKAIYISPAEKGLKADPTHWRLLLIGNSDTTNNGSLPLLKWNNKESAWVYNLSKGQKPSIIEVQLRKSNVEYQPLFSFSL